MTEHAPGPAGPGRPAAAIDFGSVARLGLLSVPDDGVVEGTSGRPRIAIGELEIEGDDPDRLGKLIRALDARGALGEPVMPVRTPTTLLYAETAGGDTIALWRVEPTADCWLHDHFTLRPPRVIGAWYLDTPLGRLAMTPEVMYSATEAGRAEMNRIRPHLPAGPDQFEY